jgi:hypothetical protein
MANRKPLIDEDGEVREITAEDAALFKPFSTLPKTEQKMLLSLLIRQENSDIAFPPFPAKNAGKDGAPSQYLEHFHSSCNAGIVLSHPSHKNKNVARVGHP